ncbi:DUF885 domain-containing protein, partial [Shewanella sp. 11B5]
MRLLILPALIMLSLLGCNSHSTTTQIAPQVTHQQTQIDNDLQAIIDQSWAVNLAFSPELAASLGDASVAAKLDDLSAETLAEKNQQTLQILHTLKQLDRKNLSKSDVINAKILQDQLQNEVDMYRF